MLLGDLPVVIVRVYAIAIGLFGGSFLNVVIHRVPRGMSIARPPSHCPACGKRLRFFDNVPAIDVNFSVTFFDRLLVAPKGGAAPALEVEVSGR